MTLSGYWRRYKTRIGFSVFAVAGFAAYWIYTSDPTFYYLLDVELEVEKEIVAIKTKVACKPRRVASSRGFFKPITIYSVDQITFGQRLESGKGVFVSPLRNCNNYVRKVDNVRRLTFKDPHPIIPLIYITDSYENPTKIRGYFSPSGPKSDALGIRLIKGVVRPLSSGQARQYTEEHGNANDPLVRKDGKLKSFEGYALHPILPGWQPEPQRRVSTSKSGRFELYHYPGGLEFYKPNAYTRFWRIVMGGGAPSFVTEPTKRYNAEISKEMEAIYSGIIPLNLGEKTFVAEFGAMGVIEFDLLARMRAWKSDAGVLSLALGNDRIDTDLAIKEIHNVVLRDNSSGVFYRMLGRSFFGERKPQ